MLRALCFVFIVICSAPSFAETAVSGADVPRSVILLIGDGFDDQHVTMGRNYLAGPDGTLLLDSLPIRGAVQVQTVAPKGGWTYVADSANTATSLATGVVTNIGRVGTGPDDQDLETILEIAASGFVKGLRLSSAAKNTVCLSRVVRSTLEAPVGRAPSLSKSWLPLSMSS
jgi:alkaline phosphatase